MKKVNDQALITYEDWIDSGRVIIPCAKGIPLKGIKNWSDPVFKISKEEWKNKYSHCEIALRLDQDIDFDIDNELAKRFIEDYLTVKDAVSGRPTNPKSHYWFKGSLDFKQFILPEELKERCKNLPHGNTLCEIRSGLKHYTIVPKSLHSKANEYVEWETYQGINKYPGDLKKALNKVALSTALCVLYASQGNRDTYCTAIAGVLIKHTDWEDKEINDFIFKIATESNDDEADKRSSKGSTGRTSNKNFGIPKLAEIIGCSQNAITTIFSWIGIQYETSEGASAIGEIVEYGQDLYEVTVYGNKEGKPTEVVIEVDGPTLMKQSFFYDAVMSQAQVWVPKMKPNDFAAIMKRKFEERGKSADYVEEANENLVFVKYFEQYIAYKSAFTDKKNLLEFQLPYYDMRAEELEFNLNAFEDFLEARRITMKRVILVRKCQKVLKAKKNKGKVGSKSCVSWKIKDYKLDPENLTIDVVPEKGKEVQQIDFEADQIEPT